MKTLSGGGAVSIPVLLLPGMFGAGFLTVRLLCHSYSVKLSESVCSVSVEAAAASGG